MRLLGLGLLIVVLASQQAWAGLNAQGRVVDLDGKAVPNVRVYAVLNCYAKTELPSSLKAATTADSDGFFTFNNLPKPTAKLRAWGYTFVAFQPGKSWGWVNGKGYLTSYGNKLPAPKGGYALPIAKLNTFEGSVADREGKPLVGAAVKPSMFLELSETCDPSG